MGINSNLMLLALRDMGNLQWCYLNNEFGLNVLLLIWLLNTVGVLILGIDQITYLYLAVQILKPILRFS